MFLCLKFRVMTAIVFNSVPMEDIDQVREIILVLI